MAGPIVIQKPVVHITEPDTPTTVDVSCDIQTLELAPDQPVTEVKRFCGTVQVPGLLTESCSVDYVVNDDTLERWEPLVGKNVVVSVWDSSTDDDGRVFDSYIGFNPGLYGTWDPGEPLLLGGQSLPVMSPVAAGAAVPPVIP